MVDTGTNWLVEHGIGETRALLIENGEIVAAKLRWPGEISVGNRLFAKLTSKAAGRKRGTATLETGQEVLVDQLPPEATEGVQIGVRITRAPIAERGRLKRAQGRCFMVGSQPLDDARTDADEPRTKDLFVLGDSVSQFEIGDWEEVWHSASSGIIAFTGGEILCSVTPAMTVIDIDGDLAPRELALAAVPAIAKALRWFDIGGNIGIDFPTLEAKADRRVIDEALEHALANWSHERTSMNGFGFVQMVARLEGPSLLHRFAASRTALCARYAIRVAERATGAGITLLRIHPALKAKIKDDWITDLERRTGRPLQIETDPGLALEAPYAQVVSA